MSTTPAPQPVTLIGWGYEGRTVEELISDAHRWDISVVADVRLNAISRRKGFSKRALTERLAEAGIEYIHLRALGNPRDNRSGFAQTSTPEGRAARANYCGHVLNTDVGRASLRALAGYRPAIVLCFEAEERCCHRALVLDAVRQLEVSEECDRGA
jgi:uncharacterized protein (DUF488 family)